jgi:hypothetical protein
MARSARRARRAERRQRKLKEAVDSSAFGSIEPQSQVIGIMSTQDLVFSTLERSIDKGLIGEDEAASFDPIVFLSLPRLAVLLGVVGAQIPLGWPMLEDVTTPSPATETEAEEGAVADAGGAGGGGSTSLTIFLPRICRALQNSTIRQLRSLSGSEVTALSEMLAGKRKSADRGGRGQDADDATAEADAKLDRLYKTIASVADRASQGRGSKAWVRVQSRALKAYLDPMAEERVPDLETIAKEFLDANR